MLFGDKIKELREEQGLLQRQLAASLEIDTPMFSKIERGDRRAKREQVIISMLIQEQQKGVEQSSRSGEHGCLHHKAFGGHSKEAGNKACSRNTTM